MNSTVSKSSSTRNLDVEVVSSWLGDKVPESRSCSVVKNRIFGYTYIKCDDKLAIMVLVIERMHSSMINEVYESIEELFDFVDDINSNINLPAKAALTMDSSRCCYLPKMIVDIKCLYKYDVNDYNSTLSFRKMPVQFDAIVDQCKDEDHANLRIVFESIIDWFLNMRALYPYETNGWIVKMIGLCRRYDSSITEYKIDYEYCDYDQVDFSDVCAYVRDMR